MQMDLFDQFLAKIFGEKTPGLLKHPSSGPRKVQRDTNTNDVSRTILLNGQQVAYTLRRSSRRSIGFLVNETGLRVTAPKRTSLQSIENAIADKQKWILSKLDFYHRSNRLSETVPIEWKSGEHLPFLGKNLTIQTVAATSGKPVFRIENDALLVCQPDDGEPLALTLKKWLAQQAKETLLDRLSFHAERMNIQFKAFGLSNARTRWGSCSAKRHIRLNWRLVHCDVSLIDYVAIHELAHCLEMNHGQRFWNIVSTYCPDYKNARKQLHIQSPLLFSLFGKTK